MNEMNSYVEITLQQHVRSTKYVDYMCCRVLPMWESIASPEQAQILTLLAELCMFTAQISNPIMAAGNVYKLLLVRIMMINCTRPVKSLKILFKVFKLYIYFNFFTGILTCSSRQWRS